MQNEITKQILMLDNTKCFSERIYTTPSAILLLLYIYYIMRFIIVKYVACCGNDANANSRCMFVVYIPNRF